MKEALDIAVWIGFGFILFIFLRGMNETQVQKHKDKLEEFEKKNNTTDIDNKEETK
jgi:hypothetical protein